MTFDKERIKTAKTKKCLKSPQAIQLDHPHKFSLYKMQLKFNSHSANKTHPLPHIYEWDAFNSMNLVL